MSDSMQIDIRFIYNQFDTPVAVLDCGTKCAPFNINGKPFCCDICHAVPAVHYQEWAYLRQYTDMWHLWRGDECVEAPEDPSRLQAETPEHMLLLACKGPDHCQRSYRSLSCRQFPFFPYVASDLRFLGLAYEWSFESVCWVISHLAQVSVDYRDEFVRVYDYLFERWPVELKSYAFYSDEMREHFDAQKRCILLLHRRGGYYLIDPASERLSRLSPEHLPRFGFYRDDT